MDVSDIGIVLQLIFLEGILSLDNAAVLGAMVSVLPDDQPIPWPRALARVGHTGDRLLGMQRDAALKVGLLGAYFGRALMLLLASWVMNNVWLRLIGGLYLLYLGMSHLGRFQEEAESDQQRRTSGRGFWGVVVAVELADLAFSLDNVVAAVALSNRLEIVMIGVALGIVTMRFAASLFARMVEREPILEPTAYVLVLMVGLSVVLDDLFDIHLGEMARFAASVGIIVLALLYAHWSPLRQLSPLLRAIGQLFRGIMSILHLPFTLMRRPESSS